MVLVFCFGIACYPQNTGQDSNPLVDVVQYHHRHSTTFTGARMAVVANTILILYGAICGVVDAVD